MAMRTATPLSKRCFKENPSECLQTFQVADRLAEQGFLVAVPDYFEGDEWPLSDFPPSDGNKFMNWVATTANTGADCGAQAGWDSSLGY